MEESIKNAEKLIYAMNVVLAQMKHDASYDDFNHIVSIRGCEERKTIRKMLSASDRGIPLCQVEDFPGVKEETTIPDNLFNLTSFAGLRMNTGFVVDEDDAKIEEINNRIEVYRQELIEKEERESLKVMNLEGLSKLAVRKSAECLASNAVSVSDTSQKSVSLIKGKSNTVTVAEDLRSKLLQTQKIVDRGIQTARELNETVELLKTKPLKSDRCEEISVSQVRKLKSAEKIAEKSDSRSTLKSSVHKKCRKCNSEIICKGRNKDKMEKMEENVMVVNLRGRDLNEKSKHRKLHTQHLPSLNIQGDLRCQKIPNIDIPPGKCEAPQIHGNTSFKFYSHEQILRDELEEAVENVNKYNTACQSKGLKSIQTVTCSNCGKVIKVPDKVIQCEQIDELLKVCNYNVFDPRIDEFVEKCGIVPSEEITFLQPQDNLNPSIGTHSARESSRPRHSKGIDISKIKKEDSVESSSGVRKMKITEFSNKLMRKYKEKAIELEEDHLQFESILRDLFKMVDESRRLFNNCDYLNKIVGEDREKQKSNLSIATPVIVSYTGSGEEVDDGKNAVMRPSKKRSRRSKTEEREMRKKIGKRECKPNSKLLSSFASVRESKKVETSENPGVAGKANKHIGFVPFLRENVTESARDVVLDIPRLEEKPKKDNENSQAVIIDKERSVSSLDRNISAFSDYEIFPVEDFTSNRPGDSASSNEDVKEAEDVSKNKANQSDYESDFEEESPEVRGVAEMRAVPDLDYSLKYNPNLSTISEVDSELDRKLSELVVSTEEMENGEKECNDENNLQQDYSGIPVVDLSPIEDASQRQHREIIFENSELSQAAKDVKDTSLLSSDDDDTTKLLNKVKRHLQEVSSQQLLYFRKEPSRTEATEQMAEIMGAMKNQFEKTETLAEKLTVECYDGQNLKETETSFLTGNHEISLNLESDEEDAGKEEIHFEDPPREMNVAHNFEKRIIRKQMKMELDEKSEIDLGDEIFKSDRKSSSPQSLFVVSEKLHLPLKSETKSERGDKSYSEGEISEQEIFCSEGSSSSIGEVINENNSDSSMSDENLVLKFL